MIRDLVTLQREAGARFVRRAGADIPRAFADPLSEMAACRVTAGWADLSHLSKLVVAGRSAAVRDLLADLASVMSVWLGADRADSTLVITSPTARSRVEGTLSGAGLRFEDVSPERGALCIVGPAAETLVGNLPQDVIEVRIDDGRHLLVFPTERGPEVWELITRRGESLGGRPVGTDALGAVDVDWHDAVASGPARDRGTEIAGS